MFWEENFTLVNMISCGRHNVSKHMEIKNGDQYNALDISLEPDYLYKREVISSESRDYMGISGNGLNTSLNLRTKRTNKKQRTSISINEITNQYFRRFIKEFNSSPYIEVTKRNRFIMNQLRLTPY